MAVGLAVLGVPNASAATNLISDPGFETAGGRATVFSDCSTISFATGTGVGGRNQSVRAPSHLPGSVRWIGADWTNAPFIGQATVTTHLYSNRTGALSPASPPAVTIIPRNLLILIGALLALLVAWRLTRPVRQRRSPGVREPLMVWAGKSRV